MTRWHLIFLALGALAVVGCGGDAIGSFAPPEGQSNAARAGAGYTPCQDGHTTPCQRIIGRHAGITSCFDGVMTCTDGEWSECQPPPDLPEEDASAPPVSEGIQ